MSRSAFACLVIGASLLSSAAAAQSAWVGRWFYVPEASRRSANSFTLAVLPGGRLRFDAGWEAFILGPGGRSRSELLHPATSVRTEMLTPASFRYVKEVDGHPVERVEQRLTSDGTRLLGHVTSIDDDGRESKHDIVSSRVGSGKGLPGTWRELPPEHDTVREAARSGTPQPYWIISQDAAGVMTWRVVPTGEVLTGSADGKQHPSAGPHRAGQSFSIKVLSPRHLQFFIYDNGHLIEQTDESLSADGKRWTDLLWTPAHPDEKDRLVYRR